MGFTLVELLAVLGVLTLLGVLAIPALANGKSGSQRAVCVNNLSRIGRAIATWGNEHGDLPPWLVHSLDGGTRAQRGGLNSYLWFHFSWLSNQLLTPKILACPSDREVRPAETFTAATGGLLNTYHQDRAIREALI